MTNDPMTNDELINTIAKLRKDEYHPWRYILFTFLNGIAYGLGMTLGMTIVLGLVILPSFV